MTRSLPFAALFLFYLPAQGSAQLKAPNGKPYNFVVILADDLGAAELGCYGHKDHRTPRIDRLAKEGMRFRTCFATPICSPSRVMLMTGRYGFRTGWYHLTGRPYSPTYANPAYDLGSSETTFADVLRMHGYLTLLVGKWQLTGTVPTLVHDCGFDHYLMWAYKNNLPPGVEHKGRWEGKVGNSNTARYWHPSLMEDGKYVPTKETDYGPDMMTDWLIQQMKKAGEKPFCAYFPMTLTHGPFEEVPDVANPGKKLAGGFKNNLEYLDHLIGKLMDALDKMGLAENTIVIFLGDNGTAARGKGTPTELGARVPCIVRCPGTIPKGVVSDELTDLTDVFPTLLHVAEAAPPKDLTIDGKNLWPTLTGKEGKHRDWIFSYLGDKRVLRDRRWLLEGDGTFYDCGDSRDGIKTYKEVTGSRMPEVLAARQRFEDILSKLPAPKTIEDLPKKKKKKDKENPLTTEVAREALLEMLRKEPIKALEAVDGG